MNVAGSFSENWSGAIEVSSGAHAGGRRPENSGATWRRGSKEHFEEPVDKPVRC